MVTQGGKFVLPMGSTVVLARLLTPQDYGLFGMVTVIRGFVSMLNDMGLSMATIQVAEINHRQISTLFWVNVAISITIMLLTAVIAPTIAWFYGEPRLVSITLVLASGMIFGGLSVQHRALLNRQMRFAALAAIDITSMLVSVATAIVSAWYGAGYWALVIMSLASAITATVGAWVMCGGPVPRFGIWVFVPC
jgi:PST family polysaccharide transporter